jgi:hypothetical protein
MVKLRMDRCDKCQVPLEASPMLISGFMVLFCKLCKRFRFLRDDQWIDGGAGIVRRLLDRAAILKGCPNSNQR